MNDTSHRPTLIPGATVIAVTSGKGGVGKTTTAVAVACHLSRQGRKVVVVDGDIDGPNVGHVASVDDMTATAVTDPIGIALPESPLGFAVAAPETLRLLGVGNPTVDDLGGLVQYATPPEFVIIDLPAGWTESHADVVGFAPDIVLCVVSPTATALSDHRAHIARWNEGWNRTTDSIRDTDRRRRFDLPEQLTFVVVETMARFTGVDEKTGTSVTIRRADALDADTMAEHVGPITSVPAAVSVDVLADSDEIGFIVDTIVVEAASAN